MHLLTIPPKLSDGHPKVHPPLKAVRRSQRYWWHLQPILPHHHHSEAGCGYSACRLSFVATMLLIGISSVSWLSDRTWSTKVMSKLTGMRSRSRFRIAADKVSELPVLICACVLYQFTVHIEPSLAREFTPIEFSRGNRSLCCRDTRSAAVNSSLGFTGSHEKGIIFETENRIRDDRDVLENIEPCASVGEYLAQPLVNLIVILNPVMVTDAVDRVFTAGLPDVVKIAEASNDMQCIVGDRNWGSGCTVNAIEVIRCLGVRVIRSGCTPPVASDFLNRAGRMLDLVQIAYFLAIVEIRRTRSHLRIRSVILP